MPIFRGRVSADHGGFADPRAWVIELSLKGETIGRTRVAPDGTFELPYESDQTRFQVFDGERPVQHPQPVPDESVGSVELVLALPRLDESQALGDFEPYIAATTRRAIGDFVSDGLANGWLPASIVSQVDDLLRDTEQFLRAADLALMRLPESLSRWSTLLEWEGDTRLGDFKPFPGGGLDLGGCKIQLRSAGAPALAALQSAPKLLGRAVTGYVRRAEAVERLHKLAMLPREEKLQPRLRSLIGQALDLGGPTGAGLGLPLLLGRELGQQDALSPASLGAITAARLTGADAGRWPSAAGFGNWPPIGFGSLDLCQLQWLECVDVLTRAPLGLPPQPPAVDRVEPSAFCQAGGTVTLWPGPGGFPAQAPQDVKLIVPIAGAIVSWSTARIDISIPAGTPAGCYPLEWEVSMLDPDWLEAWGKRAACSTFFPSSGGGHRLPAFVRHEIDHVLIASAPLARLGSGGRNTFIEAAGCTPVTVNWTVGSGFENTACRAKLALEASLDAADGQGWRSLTLDEAALASSAPYYSGESVVQSPDDRTVRLETRLIIAGQVCHVSQSTFEVRRYQELRLLAPAVVPESDFDVIVERGCPAPQGGVAFDISSSHAAIAAASGVMPAGATATPLRLSATACADVLLTASAPGHRGSQATVRVRGVPQLLSMTPTSAAACSNLQLTVTVRCAGPSPKLEIALPGGPLLLPLVPAVSGPVADPWGTVTYRAASAALPPGSWTVLVRAADGRASQAATPQVLLVMPAPVTVTASVAAFNPQLAPGANLGAVPACTGAEVVLDIEANGATEIVVQTVGSASIVRRTRAFACGAWKEQVRGLFFRGATFDITATGPGGSKTIAKTLGTLQAHPLSVGAVRVVNRSQSTVTAAVTFIDPATGQNFPLVLGEVAARTDKLFDQFIADNNIPDCVPLVCWVLLDKSYLPVQSNFKGAVAYTPAPAATPFRSVDGGATYAFDIDAAAVAGAPR